ncbi:hypothetical protein EDC55_1306 [Allofrancisella inopinata]|uniref:hypothetical protein n=1 Tax=Allofrancisella inopinata TaxID=1085647 RepID=UPI0010642787|nr:hypothetical protein [Allofrancisella inopinata]TDT66940.1 hypothetical protein EDC55_1306 [Allofrancisella inopinata]
MNQFNLKDFAEVFADMTEKNQHMESLLLMAKLVENERIIEVVKAINNIIAYENFNPIASYRDKIYAQINELGRQKYGQDSWDKNIYSNT